jgi:hypothetical protein
MQVTGQNKIKILFVVCYIRSLPKIEDNLLNCVCHPEALSFPILPLSQ